MATSDDFVFPDDECLLAPGDALVNCNGQDIAKKGGSKARNRILTIIPMHLATPSKMADSTLGALKNLNTDSPELVVPALNGSYVFKGRFEFPSTKFLSIACQPSSGKRIGQSTLTDVFDRILVFDKPKFVADKVAPHGPQSDNEKTGGDSQFTVHHGVSSAACPLKAATMKRTASTGVSLSRTSSGTKGTISRSSSVGSASNKASKGSARKGKRGNDISGESESDDNSVKSDCATESARSSDTVVDEASDAEVAFGLGGDSPITPRSRSSRRGSASKPISYKESDDDEIDEDERSFSSDSSSSSSSSSSLGVRSNNATKSPVRGKAKPTSSTTKSSSATKSSAKKAPVKADTQKESKGKAPVARKLVKSSATKTASSKKKKTSSGYFSDDNESDNISSSSRSSGGSGSDSSHSSESSDSGSESGGVSDVSGSEGYMEPASGSKKRKPAAPKVPRASKTKAQPKSRASTASNKNMLDKADKGVSKKIVSKKTAAASSSVGKKAASRSAVKKPKVICLDSSDEESAGGESDSDDDYED